MPWHATASISPHADITENTDVWRYSCIRGGAIVGDGCIIGQGVCIDSGAVIGKDCKIENGVSVFQGVVIEDKVFVGPHAVFTNVKNPRAFVERKDEFKKTVVRTGAAIGANATILPGVKIGEYAMVGAGAVVTHDVAPHSVVKGNPARHSAYICKCGSVVSVDFIKECDACAAKDRKVS